MKTILVTGANGQLGRELQLLSKLENNIQFLFADRNELDITSLDSIDEFINRSFDSNSTEWIGIINAAAYTAVDKAESEEELAYQINATGAKNLAVIAKNLNAKFVHISTDFVFDGTNHKPYLETDLKNPISIYGKTKAIGEDLVLAANPNSIIIRTSWVYSSFRKNFFTTIMNLAKDKEKLTIINDQIGTPTWAKDLARVSYKSIFQNMNGIFHYSNEGVASWYDFAHAIVNEFGFNCKVIPIPTELYPTPAKRPHYSVLNKEKFKEVYGMENPHWRENIAKLAKEFM